MSPRLVIRRNVVEYKSDITERWNTVESHCLRFSRRKSLFNRSVSAFFFVSASRSLLLATSTPHTGDGYGDDLHPLRCLLLNLLTVGSPEEAFQRRGVGRSQVPGPRPGGAERPNFWAAAIRFSLKDLFNRSFFDVFQPKIISYRSVSAQNFNKNEGNGILR